MLLTRIRNLAAMVLLISAGAASLLGADPCVPIGTFAGGQKPAREIFVATTGSNSAGDGSQANPFQTLSRAAQGLQPGDAIRLLPGTYAGGTSLRNIAGTSNAPIWLGGVPGLARPLLNGGSTALHLSRVRYLIVENLEVAGATGNGINCDDGGDYANDDATRHVLFRHLSIHDIGKGGNNDGLKLSGVNDFFVLDCEFARLSAGGSGIDHVGCHRGLIARSSFTDAGSNSIQCKGGSEDIEIRSNRFINGGGRAINMGGSTGFRFFRPPLSTNAPNVEAKNIRVIANLFRGGDAPVAFVGCVDSLVANNTIIEPRRWLVRILQETVSRGDFTFRPCGNNQFANNLIVFDRSHLSVPVNIGPNTDAGSIQFANNLWFDANQPGQSRPALPSAEDGGVYGLNPLFRDAAAGDFSVPSNSPAAGKGQALPNLRADLLENCFAETPTIGAFEANSPASVLFSESFDDPRLLERGWYDGSKFTITDQQTYAGKGCLEYTWKSATTTPFNSSGIRRLFEASDVVYLRCYIRLSQGWGWTGRNYHPHLMHFMTTENQKFHGPAGSHLTVYIEPQNGRLRLAAQDIQNKDQPHGLTQGPLRGGYNGQFFDSEEALFNDDRWHRVEAMFQLNSLDLSADKANADGIVRGWFDGKLVIDRTDVILRSPDFPKMKFNQYLLTPYFGPGLLPHEQTLWIDELAVGTKRLGPASGK